MLPHQVVPRYDATLTPEQRSSIDNGMYLCGTYSIMIDKHGGIDFSADELREWKMRARHMGQGQSE